jgi:hypothetical protein
MHLVTALHITLVTIAVLYVMGATLCGYWMAGAATGPGRWPHWWNALGFWVAFVFMVLLWPLSWVIGVVLMWRAKPGSPTT